MPNCKGAFATGIRVVCVCVYRSVVIARCLRHRYQGALGVIVIVIVCVCVTCASDQLLATVEGEQAAPRASLVLPEPML